MHYIFLDSTDLDISRASMMPKCLANCDNQNSSILVNVLFVRQSVRLLAWVSFM